jgi:hypothetical protein
MTQSTNLQLPFLAAGQAQKHVTVNESLLRLDALVQLCAVSDSVDEEPSSSDDGALYILPSGKTGDAWDTMADHALAYWRDGTWEEIARAMAGASMCGMSIRSSCSMARPG